MPVRLPLRMIKKIARLADALCADRSKAIRWTLKQGLESGVAIGLLRSGKGRGLAGKIAAGMMGAQKARLAAAHASSAAPANKPEAEVRALRTAEEAQVYLTRLADQLALKQAHKPQESGIDPSEIRPRRATEILSARHRPKRSRRPRAMTDAEIKAAADRAEARKQPR